MRKLIVRYWLVSAALAAAFSVVVPDSTRGAPNCTCRYAGQSYALNTCVCIVMPDGARMACCGMVLNNTSWTFTRDGCPIASIPDRIPTQSIAGPLRPTGQEKWRQDDRRPAGDASEDDGSRLITFGPTDARLRNRELFSLQFGLTSLLTEGLYVEPTVSFGLNGTDNDVVLGVSLPYSFTPRF